MNDSRNPETVGTSFFATGAGATLSRTTCAARASAYRCVLVLPSTGDFLRSSKNSPFGRTSLRCYSQPFVRRTHYLDRVVRELGVEQPTGPRLVDLYASVVARDIVDGAITPYDGSMELRRLWLSAGCPSHLQLGGYFEDEWE